MEEKKLLSTSSPEGIQIASKITPERLANLLIRKGPLPIRHITNQLSLEVQGFDQLSLSKQRRLIMAAMEQTDTVNNVVFEKIGWGQWAVRKVDSDYIVTEGTEAENNSSLDSRINTSPGNTVNEEKHINVNDLRKQPNLKLGWSKKKDRRESITNNKSNLHNVKLPNEKLSTSAIVSDSEEDSDDDIEDIEEDAIEDAIEESSSEEESSGSDDLFKFDHELESKRSPPIKFANRVPLKLSPPPSNMNSNSRRKSSSSSVVKNTNYKQIFNRSRLNSLDNLDNYIISSAKNSNLSFNSPPPPPPAIAMQNISGSPLSSWSSNNYGNSPNNGEMMHNRRKSSFNESNIRSTLSSSIPSSVATPSNSHMLFNKLHENSLSDTDEEDWATIGAESLRQNNMDSDETKAALALVDLMSV